MVLEGWILFLYYVPVVFFSVKLETQTRPPLTSLLLIQPGHNPDDDSGDDDFPFGTLSIFSSIKVCSLKCHITRNIPFPKLLA